MTTKKPSKIHSARKHAKSAKDNEQILDDRIGHALNVVEGEIQARADKLKAIAHQAASDKHDVLVQGADAEGLDEVDLVQAIRSEVRKAQQAQLTAPTCPRCGSEAVAVQDQPADPGSVADPTTNVGKVLRCNQCGFQPGE